MELVFKKISSYNLFNYLFTGFIFIFLCQLFLDQKAYIESDSRLIEIGNLFWIYFIGLTISRLGSIMIEPVFKKLVGFAPYNDFLEAEKLDSKLPIINEQNNIYRTVLGTLILFAGYYLIVKYFPPECFNLLFGVLIVSLIVLFAFSYAKQIGYIKKRVKQSLKNKDSNNAT